MQNTFLIQNLEEKETKHGDPYLVVQLLNKDGALSAKIWNTSLDKSPVQKGDIVTAELTENQYNGQLDYIVKSVSAEDGKKLSDFLPAEENIEEMYAFLMEDVIAQLDDPYHEILTGIFTSYKEAICTYPADEKEIMIGGYVRHLFEAVRLSLSAIEVYEHADSDLILGGILLKEIGFLTRYDFSAFELRQKSYLPTSILTCDVLSEQGRKLGHREAIDVLLETMYSEETSKENYIIDVILTMERQLHLLP